MSGESGLRTWQTRALLIVTLLVTVFAVIDNPRSIVYISLGFSLAVLSGAGSVGRRSPAASKSSERGG